MLRIATPVWHRLPVPRLRGVKRRAYEPLAPLNARGLCPRAGQEGIEASGSPRTPAPTLYRKAGEGARARQRGYTLIEVIVAFALLAAALTLLLGTLSGAARQVRGSADAGRAALHAQSLLDQVGVGEELKPEAREGEFEDGIYRWALQVRPWADPSQPPDAPRDPSSPRLLEVAMLVQWGDGGPRQRLALRTLRMQPAGLDAGVQ